jgi:hypothetical protein
VALDYGRIEIAKTTRIGTPQHFYTDLNCSRRMKPNPFSQEQKCQQKERCREQKLNI